MKLLFLCIVIAIALCGAAHDIYIWKKKPRLAKKPGLKAQVMCGGTHAVCPNRYIYDGPGDCKLAAGLYGGPSGCEYGCIGLGSCAKACPKGAIHILDGCAAVDRLKCDGCGYCLEACPKQLIKLIPESAKYWVCCSSPNSGCKVGCTGCGNCADACKASAIKISDGRAQIDYSLCTGCGNCASACPNNAIWTAP